MFDRLEKINTRPEPFCAYTAADLWTDPHISEKMLEFHLNGDLDISSRRTSFIDRSVEWICSRFQVGPDTRIADFGCGPGLYAIRLARKGARVTGIDFSGRSIDYARNAAEKEGLSIDYVHQDYLTFETGDRFDLICMIMCDFCALSPDQRKKMLEKFHGLLAPGGAVLLDVYSLSAFDARQETAVYEPDLMDGFWSSEKYYGFLNCYKYDREKVVLDQYTLVQKTGVKTVYNWLQYFSVESLKKEFENSGFSLEEMYCDVAGRPFDPKGPEMAAVAIKSGEKG